MADDSDTDKGLEPNDDETLGGSREQDDQHGDDDGVSPEIRRLRAEAKRLRLERNEARERAKTFEDRDKTEEQRRQEELSTATSRADAAERRLLRYEVAAELGIPSSLAGRLQGDTRAELVEDAKALAKEFGIDTTGNGGTPPGFSSGVRRPVPKGKQTMNDVILRASGR